VGTCLVLRTAIGSYGHTEPLKNGAIRSERLRLDHVEVEPINRAFRRMTRDAEFDVSEMAITTQVIAHSFDKPITPLPIVLFRGFPHGAIACRKDGPVRTPFDLAGRRVGVRAYSQTTAVWVRGVLAHDYGVDLNRLTWVVLEGSHVDEYEDPPNVERAAPGSGLRQMLLSGEVDAAVGLGQLDSPRLTTLILDPEAAAAGWYRRTGVYPINHLVVVRRELLAAHPWLADELLSMFTAAKEQYLARLRADGPASSEDRACLRQTAIVGDDPLPYGIEPNRAAAEMLVEFAAKQKLAPRVYGVEELFHVRALQPSS
jgi:4,5-dihydroxyphthalate decarboxylase